MENEINNGHYLELMDRLHVTISNIDTHILQHQLSEVNKDIQNKINEAMETLMDVYQMVGNKIPE